MKRMGTGMVIALALIGGLSLTGSSAQRPYQVAGQAKDFYYGHVSFVDLKNDGQDPVIQREGAAGPEIARLNAPLGPGDVIRTSGTRRLEAQFDNGTILRLDTETEIKIETILAQSLSSRQQLTNLSLRRGRIYAMYKHYGNLETFQVITPTTAVKMNHGTVAMIGLTEEGGTDVQVKYGKAFLRYGPDEKSLRDQTVRKNERMTIGPDHRFALQAYEENTDFELWNKAVNEDFVALHEGKSYLPSEIKSINPAVWDFAQRFGNIYGEWLYDRMFGYVWRPFYNDIYPWGNWQPYYYGHWTNWTSPMGGMFWVPDEPWGWVPYHLGVWHWNAKRGWYWIPGSAFAPAWVDWAFYFGGYFAWHPMVPWRWFWQDYFFDGLEGFDAGFGYGGWPWYYWGGSGFAGSAGDSRLLTKITKNQLKARPGSPPRLSAPKEFEKGYAAFRRAVLAGDPETLASLDGPGRSFMVLAAADLASADLQGKIVPGDVFLSARAAAASNPAHLLAASLPARKGSLAERMAVQAFARQTVASAGPRADRPASRAIPSAVRMSLPSPAARFRDWNPDLKAARALGVTIRYASARNEVVCPEKGITSSSVVSRTTPMLGGGFLGRMSAGSIDSGASRPSSLGSGGSGSSAGTVSSGSSTATSSGSSGGSVAGGVKK